MSLARAIAADPRVLDIIGVVGVPYSWGAGNLVDLQHMDPADPNTWPKGLGGGRGVDCSAVQQWVMLRLGMIDVNSWDNFSEWKDATANTLAMKAFDPIDPSDAQLGDAYFYKGNAKRIYHVTPALGFGLCLHASSGSGARNVNGQHTSRAVQVVHYERAGPFLVAGRLKPHLLKA